ncbi:DUF2796 domain-containing protein [Leeia sp. TBRC 13508]|uniref:DUF2796 domain-containing protein n=1 Tax=Leeia speluncae TaxID=2884804 RepID=A0ABS8D9V5_9NEIS|nr:DUF2796 domain-containing protein [Leeia speluncae]MCB6184932.1 DUF2796 domain-containing protein [Leeia speluncae]
MKKISSYFGISLFAIANYAYAAPAHQHGKASLDIAIEHNKVLVSLESPLDNLLGFEHAPKTPAEIQLAKKMASTLMSKNGVITLPTAANCKLSKVTLESAAISAQYLGGKIAPEKENPFAESDNKPENGHADLDGSFEFTCANIQAISEIQVSLFQHFPHTQSVQVQLVSGKLQKAFTLTPKQNKIHF